MKRSAVHNYIWLSEILENCTAVERLHFSCLAKGKSSAMLKLKCSFLPRVILLVITFFLKLSLLSLRNSASNETQGLFWAFIRQTYDQGIFSESRICYKKYNYVLIKSFQILWKLRSHFLLFLLIKGLLNGL